MMTWHSTNRRGPQAPIPLTCAAVTSAHDAVDPKPYLLGLRHVVVLCRGCYGAAILATDVRPDRRRLP